MNIQECTEKSIYIVSEYYSNSIDPYFENMVDHMIWHGPAIGQQITGRDKMREA